MNTFPKAFSSSEEIYSVLLGFGGIIASQWLLLLLYTSIRRVAFEVETIAFFLCTLGMAALATVAPGESIKQLVAMALGIFVFHLPM